MIAWFQLSGLSRWWVRSAPARQRPASQSLYAAANDLPAVAAESSQPVGCGWFDSSRELHQGLQVLEHQGAQDLSEQMPLAPWLELYLLSSVPDARSENPPPPARPAPSAPVLAGWSSQKTTTGPLARAALGRPKPVDGKSVALPAAAAR